MSYLEELKTLTAELESLNVRVQEQYDKHGIPSHVSLIAIEGKDAELEALVADSESYQRRWAAFIAKYNRPGVDPHTIE